MCSLVCLPRWHATFWQMWVGRPGAPGSERALVRGGDGGRGVKHLVTALCVCSYLCKWIIFPLHLAEEKAVPSVTSLLICPTPSHFLMCFKRIIWWQDYIKPTAFLGALLANISTSLQQNRYLSSSLTGSEDGLVRLPTISHFTRSSGLGAGAKGLNAFPWGSGFQTALWNPQVLNS